MIDVSAHQRSLSSNAASSPSNNAAAATAASNSAQHNTIASMLMEALADTPATSTQPHSSDVTEQTTAGAMDVSYATGGVNEGASTSKHTVVNELVKLPNGKCEYLLRIEALKLISLRVPPPLNI